MAHTVRDKARLIRRVQRLSGQVDAVKRALEDERACGDIMLRITTARGALDSLMAEVVEGHVHEHMVDRPGRRTASEVRAARDLVGILRRYVR
ncbi:MAG: metal/formaldehyde-sensitive transcriptional repressor [Gemmatimonadota bacterium]|nr:metal/formaldehyde-sensitive transcriptional repressor [Gemmatimonadota bacterium]MDE3217510.1 metal/formaldehyde-sensitive transcriptional repressor [Gemmatimonadota bacterium]